MQKPNQIVSILDFKNKGLVPSPPEPCEQPSNNIDLEVEIDQVAGWLARLRPVQIEKLANHQQEALLDGYRLVLAGMTRPEIERAKIACAEMKENYIVEPGTFKNMGARIDDEQQFRLASRAGGYQPAAWHTLEARTFHSVIEMQRLGLNIKDLNWQTGKNAWIACYKSACWTDDVNPAALHRRPAAQQQALEHKQNREAVDRGCVGMHAVLASSLPPQIEPPPSGEYLAKIRALGIRPR